MGATSNGIGGDSSIFLGIERPDWALVQPPSMRMSVYALTGDNVSAAAGRLAFALGMQGPCASIDTACASALSAVHGASHAMRSGECVDALPVAEERREHLHGRVHVAEHPLRLRAHPRREVLVLIGHARGARGARVQRTPSRPVVDYARPAPSCRSTIRSPRSSCVWFVK